MVRRFGELEAQLMEVLWNARGPLTVREVRAQLTREQPPAFTTVQTVLNILHGKGWLDRSLAGRAHQYWPRATREDYVAGLMRHALDETDNRGAALARFVDQMAPTEIDELSARLASLRENAQHRARPEDLA
ncbi:BlaI/MecI/CopY family transcriptional regulator [Lipingzhangella sp. LS1_29]|uniref:BlaI/MecI/CopY family transcriptional regulator n=1 Tax=Lipingzhangella rawalii TaxID=2055835 RepID=A0ABU2H6E9_9ACTN|nr:BlaI/MecI/CopY family transcriptional regulator [Lipingzhangella rawalii]MDS1270871.1 BlaI/MecI/CopY family transcriptional regulator [Lipingzhangella rawalii]